MRIDELLLFIKKIAKDNNIGQPLLVGGVPRDRIIGIKDKVSDIRDFDITTGGKDSLTLAKLLHSKLQGSYFNIFDDGHSAVDYLGVHMDFSSNFVIPGIEDILKKMGVKDIDNMKKELYSRDFTINTLLEDLDFSDIYDLTGEAIGDIKARIIRCPIDPNITIGVDARRILRAIKFSVKYGFNIEDSLKSAMFEHRHSIQKLPSKFVQDKISEITRIDPDLGIDYLIEYKILPLVQLPKSVYDILIQKRKLIKAL